MEVPAGGSDGEDLLLAAQRELREETGYRAARWQALSAVQSFNGVAAASGHVFLARDLAIVGGAELETEGIDAVEAVPVTEVVPWSAAGRSPTTSPSGRC